MIEHPLWTVEIRNILQTNEDNFIKWNRPISDRIKGNFAI